MERDCKHQAASGQAPGCAAPRIGVVGVPDGWSTQMLLEAVGARTGARELVDLERAQLDWSTGQVHVAGRTLSNLDALVVRKLGQEPGPALLDRLHLLEALASSGVRVFPSPAQLRPLLNRLDCTAVLRAGSIPMPPTVVTEDLNAAAEAVRAFGTAVLKPLYSTKARGMQLVYASETSLHDKLRAFQRRGHTMVYVQKKREIAGQDQALVFLGGQYLGAYARVGSAKSWNTTVREGGHYVRFDPSPEVIELAGRAQALFGLPFASVDLIQTEHGAEVLEVSAFGGFRGLGLAVGLQAAPLLVDYVCEQLGH